MSAATATARHVKHRTPPRYRCQRCGEPFWSGGYDNANRFCSRAHWYASKGHGPAIVAAARALWDRGLTINAIARELELSRNTIGGMAARQRRKGQGFAARPSPIRRSA